MVKKLNVQEFRNCVIYKDSEIGIGVALITTVVKYGPKHK